MAAPQAPPGLDLQRLGAWFVTAVPGSGGRLSAELIAGGKSNLTYVVTDGSGEWIVRRPPLGHVLATAHDMAREYRVMSALQDTVVPVPRTYALCQDDDVLGAPFYVMERVAGTPYRRAAELENLGAQRTRTISQGLVDTLAALHEVDPSAVGLADFGRPEGFLERQVRRWKKQLDASHTRDLPAADELYAALAADVPMESAAGIVHGDFRLDNLLVDDSDETTAVLDWEMATLGDPLMELGATMSYWVQADDDDFLQLVRRQPTNVPGMMTRAEVVEYYAERTGRSIQNWTFYQVYGMFRVAGIMQQLYRRYVEGGTHNPIYAEMWRYPTFVEQYCQRVIAGEAV